MAVSTPLYWHGPLSDQTGQAPPLPRRVRHITSIQIRNLTPFPARDALASALTKPAEQSQFTPYGHFSDDLDVTLGRKRGRRFSTASSTLSGPRGDDESGQGGVDRSGEPTLRRRTSSRASIPLSSSAGSSSSKLGRRPSTAGAGSATRPTHRPRTLSHASPSPQNAGSSSHISGDIVTSTSSIFPGLFHNTSQKHLEKVLQSRLVETFVTITVVPSKTQEGTRPTTPASARERSQSRSTTPSRLSSDHATPGNPRTTSPSKGTARRSTIGAANAAANHATPGKHAPSSSTSSSRSPAGSHAKSPSQSSSANGRTVKPSSATTPQKPRKAIPPSLTSSSLSSNSYSTSGRSSPKPSPGSSKPAEETLPVPDYISPIHRPSTNPMFQLSQYEFAPGVDLSTSKLRVEVWGRADPGDTQSVDGQQPAPSPFKGKGKERPTMAQEGLPGWKLLESWEVDLNRLPPLPEDLATHPNHMPSNTLLITLTNGETLYLPPSSLRSASPSRPPSPNTGYSSDPEAEVHRARENGDTAASLLDTKPSDAGLERMPISPTMSEIDGGDSRRKRAVKSASLQDILKLINLQACILDTEQSLGEIVREVDKMVVHNEVGVLLREISEREAWVSELRDERIKVEQDSSDLRRRIEERREDLRQRRETLAIARQAHDEDLAAQLQVEETITEERIRLSSLREIIPIMRSNLISIVSFIYPIELVSPPDLLFTILDVPLPIPVGATDPAPPLSLPAHKEVTEDSVATALGYAAQVVQLLAAYMGHRLVYPVTCVGSRSMIKDGISAMVGPRNFPLFSKGVDTYRFEYGVFLLNKDIEMLMTERNLRALDMRHTLPNLKNLLLTLTDNEQRSIPGLRVASSSVSISSLQSQSPVPTKPSLPAFQPTSGTDGIAVDSDSAAPSSESPLSELGADVSVGVGASASAGNTPPTSGSTTPTRGSQQRKSRAFLDLAPLTGFLSLRSRYPSSPKPPIKPVAEASDTEALQQVAGSGSGSGLANGGPQNASMDATEFAEDEDDRKTIRAGGTASGEDVEVVEGKAIAAANGDARHASVGREKVTDDDVARSSPMIVNS